MTKSYTTIINSYAFDNMHKEEKIVEMCGFANEALKLIHPTAPIRIYYERARRMMKMEMVHRGNFCYERPTQYKNAMKLFDLAISCIVNEVPCEIVDGAILSPCSKNFVKANKKGKSLND